MGLALKAFSAGSLNDVLALAAGDTIVAIDNGDSSVTLDGDLVSKYTVGRKFYLSGTDSGTDDGWYTVDSRSLVGGDTVIITTVAPAADDVTGTGTSHAHVDPAMDDNLDMDGLSLTQGTVAALASMTADGGRLLTLTGNFTCPDAYRVAFKIPNGVTATLNFGTAGVDPGFVTNNIPNGGNGAIEIESGGTLTDATGGITSTSCNYFLFYLNSGGTVTDVSGSVNVSGVSSHSGGIAYNNGGTWTDFSGNATVTSANAYAFFLDGNGTWGDISGNVTVSGDSTIVIQISSGTWTNCSGTLNHDNFGGYTIYIYSSGSTMTEFGGALNIDSCYTAIVLNGGTLGTFSGNATVSATYGIDGRGGSTIGTFSGTWLQSGAVLKDTTITNLTGIIGNPSSQPDLAAGNIKSGNTILGVAGTLDTAALEAAAAAGQLATDKATIVREKAHIAKDFSLLGTTGADRGTLDVTADNGQIIGG